MANKIMKTLTLGGNTYEIYDETARNNIASVENRMDELEEKSASGILVDTELSETSTNPVQNAVVTVKFSQLSDTNNAITNVVQPLSEAIQSVSDDLDAHISESNTKVSEIENNVADIQTELDNYYKKEETYSQTEIDDKISDIDVTSQLNSLESKIAEIITIKKRLNRKFLM